MRNSTAHFHAYQLRQIPPNGVIEHGCLKVIPPSAGHHPLFCMLDLDDPLVQVRVTSATCSSVAILSTLYRLFVRRKKLWIDDIAALVSMLVLLVQMIALFVIPQSSPYNDRAWYYMVAVTFFCVLWSARLSILLSLIRINPFPDQYGKLRIVAIIFPLIPFLLILQCILTCLPDRQWSKQHTIPVCSLDDWNAVCQLIADILADGVLLYVPTRLLMILSDKTLRIRLILIFSTCIITSMVGLAHATETFKSEYGTRIYTAIIENTIALIVCNIPIILTSVIDLKESPWEERLTGRFLLELRNLDLESSTISPQTPNHTDTSNTQHSNPTSPSTNHNRIIVLAFPEPVALLTKEEANQRDDHQSPISI